jgi:anti-sigma B factor antagonist
MVNFGRRGLSAAVERVGDVVVIRPKGRISIYGGGEDLRGLVLDALDRGERNLLLNLREVSFIDSSGLGELIAARSVAQERGGAVRLCSPSEKVFNLLQMISLCKLFDVLESEEDGLAAFAANAPS